MSFVKSYSEKRPIEFCSSLDISIDRSLSGITAPYCVAGSIGKSGLIAALTPKGDISWAFEISSKSKSLKLTQVVLGDENKIFALGLIDDKSTKGSVRCAVLSFRTDGKLAWSQELSVPGLAGKLLLTWTNDGLVLTSQSSKSTVICISVNEPNKIGTPRTNRFDLRIEATDNSAVVVAALQKHSKLDLKTSQEVVKSLPKNKLNAIKKLQKITGLGLRQVKNIIEAGSREQAKTSNAIATKVTELTSLNRVEALRTLKRRPAVIEAGLTKATATKKKKELEAVGANVSIIKTPVGVSTIGARYSFKTPIDIQAVRFTSQGLMISGSMKSDKNWIGLTFITPALGEVSLSQSYAIAKPFEKIAIMGFASRSTGRDAHHYFAASRHGKKGLIQGVITPKRIAHFQDYGDPHVGSPVDSFALGFEYISLSETTKSAYDVRLLTINQKKPQAVKLNLKPEAVLVNTCRLRTGGTLLTGLDMPGESSNGLVLALNENFDSCKSTPLPAPAKLTARANIAKVVIAVEKIEIAVSKLKVIQTKVELNVKDLCKPISPQTGDTLDMPEEDKPDDKPLQFDNQTVLQSPFLNIQTCASDGTDAVRGIMCRWFFGGKLAENHLAKGRYFETVTTAPTGFNRPNDYVHLWRFRYNPRTPQIIFDFTQPAQHIDHDQRLWAYEVSGRLAYLRFDDLGAYQSAQSATNAETDPAGFLQAYGAGRFSFELKGELAYKIDWTFRRLNSSIAHTAKIECLSANFGIGITDSVVTVRDSWTNPDPSKSTLAAQLNSARWTGQNCILQNLRVHYYRDALLNAPGEAGKGLQPLGKFALTTQDITAKARLHTQRPFEMHDNWAKFQDGAKVNATNYEARWSDIQVGLKHAVTNYLHISEDGSNPTAATQIAEDMSLNNDPSWEPQTLNAEYLTMLNIAAADYHNARVLGLGYIDPHIKENETWFYLASYFSAGDPGDGVSNRLHVTISLPTSLQDVRPAPPPELTGFTYGLTMPTANGTSYSLTDPQGYTPDGEARYVGLNVTSQILHQPPMGFHNPGFSFHLAPLSPPVLLGISYRKVPDTSWQQPEILHDTLYQDTTPASAGGPHDEVMPTLFPAQMSDTAFVHKETHSGIHEYAAYSIDIFSRASDRSQLRATDTTLFKLPNRLLPPSNFHTTLIQPEDYYSVQIDQEQVYRGLILTTAEEQAMLEAIPDGDDPTLIRVVFNYNHVQDNNYARVPVGIPSPSLNDYVFADEVELFFREAPPQNVSGRIATVTQIGPGLWRVTTGDYTYDSSQEIISPVLMSTDRENFIGSVIVSGLAKFFVTDIITQPNGSAPQFTVKPFEEVRLAADHDGQTSLAIDDTTSGPQVDDLFMAIENLARADSWQPGNPLSAKITIGHSGWQRRQESYPDDLQGETTITTRGFWEDATVTHLTGDQYEIIFNNFVLPLHSQATGSLGVKWWKGTVRLPISGHPEKPRRILQVESVTKAGIAPTKIICTDMSGERTTLPVVTGSSIEVNYYPGYKAYIRADLPSSLIEANILPADGDGVKNTIMAVRSVDTDNLDELGQPYCSALGTPGALMAQELIDPGMPDRPFWSGHENLSTPPSDVELPAYVTPPDSQGKSSYSLRVNFNKPPFAVSILRTDILSILRSLYKLETIFKPVEDTESETQPSSLEKGIADNILPMNKDKSFTKRIWELVSIKDGDDTPTLSLLPLGGNAGDYQLPPPDHDDVVGPQPGYGLRIQKAIESTLLPLTPQPLIYDWINPAPPHKGPQKILDSLGNPLPEQDRDAAPMATKSGNFLNFIDYTIDGTQSADIVYFYCAREFGNKMGMGAVSAFSAPVRLVNTSPPAAPQILKVLARSKPTTKTRPHIELQLLPPLDFDEVTGIHLYRSYSGLASRSLRKMDQIMEIAEGDLVRNDTGSIILRDDFSELADTPFGETLFYRLCWIRHVSYVDASSNAHTAVVISEPSHPVLTNIVDTSNPKIAAPTISRKTTNTGDKLVLSWEKVAHNCSYIPCQITPNGTWIKLGEVKSNDPALMNFELSDGMPIELDGDKIYYRFKIDVVNASGLTNLQDRILSVALQDVS